MPKPHLEEITISVSQENDSSSEMDKEFDGNEVAFERDYSKMDLVDLIDQPAWKSILLDLVETEKMNPWDIDVVVLAEKYLKKIGELEGNNLRVPANAILACAILVKTKSKYLKLSSLDEVDEKDIALTPEQRALMLNQIPDLMSNRMAREGRITLDELVSSIEDIIQRTTPKKNSARNIPRMEINFDASTIEEKMQEVFDLVKSKADSQGIVLFTELLIDRGVDSIVETFLPILFLMNNGKVLAYQNEFFGEIFVKLIVEVVPAKSS
ncbi:MAG: ScpA family protein [archaeon]|jgi:segregation and condensation protein A